MTSRSYRLPLGDGVNARMLVSRFPDWESPLPPEWLTRLPGGNELATLTMPKRDVINWGFGSELQRAVDQTTPETRRRLGLRAMRGVLDALEVDARRHAPAKYAFQSASPSHRKLYQSLAERAAAFGYEMLPNGDIVRRFAPLGASIGRDAMADALLYGGAGAAGLYGASRA